MSKRPKLPLTEPLGNGEDPPSTSVDYEYIYITKEEYDRAMQGCYFKTIHEQVNIND